MPLYLYLPFTLDNNKGVEVLSKILLAVILAIFWGFLLSSPLIAGPNNTPGGNMVKLENLKWSPAWVSNLGCLKGCLDYLKVKVSAAWLYGASGHAFVLNIHPELCPSGPTAWKTKQMMDLCKNVGCQQEVFASDDSQKDFLQVRKAAWDKVRQAIDNKTPCYGWAMNIWEYYVINGYDTTGYFFQGPQSEAGQGPLAWDKMGWIIFVIVKPATPPPDQQVVKEALLFATQYAKDPGKWTEDGYKGGLAAYDLWIQFLRDKKAEGLGPTYNAAVWAECRSNAVGFLREAKGRLDKSLSPLFDEAIGHYQVVSQNLGKISEMFPFTNDSGKQKDENVKDEKKHKAAIDLLQAARDAEEKGVAVLQQIVDKL